MEPRFVLIIVRHGQSEANVADIVVSTPENGCLKYGLTELGRQQAAETGKEIQHWLKENYGNVEQEIWCSDFRRTRETAAEIAHVLNCKVNETELLRERNFGDFELQPADGTYTQVWERDEHDADHKYMNVESVRSVCDRALQLVNRIIPRQTDDHGAAEYTGTSVSRNDNNNNMEPIDSNRHTFTADKDCKDNASGSSSSGDWGNNNSHMKAYILVSHGDTSQILQTQFVTNTSDEKHSSSAISIMDMKRHRSLPHLNPGGWRVLIGKKPPLT